MTGKAGKSRPARMPAKAKAKKAAPATKAAPKVPTEAPQATEPTNVILVDFEARNPGLQSSRRW